MKKRVAIIDAQGVLAQCGCFETHVENMIGDGTSSPSVSTSTQADDSSAEGVHFALQ